MSARTLVDALAALTTMPAVAVSQDGSNGEDDFKKCRACHQVGEDAKNVV